MMPNTVRGKTLAMQMLQGQQAAGMELRREMALKDYENQNAMNLHRFDQGARDKRQDKSLASRVKAPPQVVALPNSIYGYAEGPNGHIMMENQGTSEAPKWVPYAKPAKPDAAPKPPKTINYFEPPTKPSDPPMQRTAQWDEERQVYVPLKVENAASASPAKPTATAAASAASKGSGTNAGTLDYLKQLNGGK
jgi:hypothetical protein